MTRVINKAKIALQDLAIGLASEQQVRDGQPYVVDQVSLAALGKKTSFTTGGTLNSVDDYLVWLASDGGNNVAYYWSGTLPKIVPANSDPDSTGGRGEGRWKPIGVQAPSFGTKIYATINEGLNNTEDTEFFYTPSSAEGVFLILYYNNAGVAEEDDRFPNWSLISQAIAAAQSAIQAAAEAEQSATTASEAADSASTDATLAANASAAATTARNQTLPARDEAVAAAASLKAFQFVPVVGTTHTVTESDAGKVILFNTPDECTLTIPDELTEAVTVGLRTYFRNAQGGLISIETTGSDLLTGAGNSTLDSTLLGGLYKEAAAVWVSSGYLEML